MKQQAVVLLAAGLILVVVLILRLYSISTSDSFSELKLETLNLYT